MLYTLMLLPHLLVAQAPAAAPAQIIARTARTYLGETYVWGDIGEDGYDCSSFVQAVFRQSGYALPRTSRDQAEMGEAVRRGRVRPGDLLFFTSAPGSDRISHVGIALAGGRMIHASRGESRVVISDYTSPYFRHRWYAARRLG